MPLAPPRNSLIVLPQLRYLLVIVVFLIITGTIVVIPGNPVRTAFYWNVVRPNQEERFGFTSAWNEKSGCLEITRVQPGGAFAKAGVKTGDVPWAMSCFGEGAVEAFFSGLGELHGRQAKLRFIENGCTDDSAELVTRLVTVP